jgi:transcription elongation factor S-II
VFNLKDKKNPELRENVLCGVIAPEKIATMSSEEMASDEVRIHNVKLKCRAGAGL